MTDRMLEQLPSPHLGRLEEVPRTELTLEELAAYGLHGTAAQEPLYRIEGNRSTKISEHFTAGELGQALGQEFAYARISRSLVVELEKLRTFFGEPVEVTIGCPPRSYWEGRPELIERAAENHGDGLAVRIRIAKVPPPLVARHAILIGARSTSYSIGETDLHLAVQQEVPVLASHIGAAGPSWLRGRLRRELAVAQARQYHAYVHGAQRVVLGPLADHFQTLRTGLIGVEQRIERLDRYRGVMAHQSEQSRIVRFLNRDHGLPPDLLLQLLFYSPYYTVFRAFWRLVVRYRSAPPGSRAALAPELVATSQVADLLCPGVAALHERAARGPARGEQRLPPGCSSDVHRRRIPVVRYDARHDEPLREALAELVRRATANAGRAPAQQRAVVLGAQRAKNVLAPPSPDVPRRDITGRYETLTPDLGHRLGETLVVNQAGLHLDAVHAWVDPPQPLFQIEDHSLREFPLHGDQTADGYVAFYEDVDSAAYQLDIEPRSDGSLDVVLHDAETGSSRRYPYRKVSDRPTHLGVDHLRAPRALHLAETSPLLTAQLDHLASTFGGPRVPAIDGLLERYWSPPVSFDAERLQREAAREIDDVFDVAQRHPRRGVHPRQRDLAGLYIAWWLARRPWAPSGRDRLTRYDYVRMMVEQQQQRGFSGGVEHVRQVFGLPKVDGGAARFVYDVEVDLRGAGAAAGLGGNVIVGDLTITKLEEEVDGVWPVGSSVRYGLTSAGLSAGSYAGLIGIEGRARFSSPIEWLPGDFPGFGALMRVEGGVSGPGVEVSVEAVIIQLERSKGDFDVQFAGAGVTPGKIDDPSGGGHVDGNVIYLSGPDTEPGFTLEPTIIRKDYAIRDSGLVKTFTSFAGAEVTDEVRQLIRHMCALELPEMSDRSSSIRIRGYADSIGDEDANRILSENRAQNVRQAIEDVMGRRWGDRRPRIDATGLGEAAARRATGDEREEPRYRGTEVALNGRVVLSLRETHAP